MVVAYYRLLSGYAKFSCYEGVRQFRERFPEKDSFVNQISETTKFPVVVDLLSHRGFHKMVALKNLLEMDGFVVNRNCDEIDLLSYCQSALIPYTIRTCDNCKIIFETDDTNGADRCVECMQSNTRFVYIEEEVLFTMIEANLRMRFE